MVKQSRHKKRKIRKTFTRKSKFFRMKGGDSLDCEKEGFNYEMKLAGLGDGYGINVDSLHIDGEQWDINKLINFLNWLIIALHITIGDKNA